jgi:DNA-binding transcriptional regulator/RsmH inhibitor MraZ
MVAAEFQTKVVKGRIEIPPALRDQFQGEVSVILFAEGADQDESAWPKENRRRWELIARQVRHGLTDAEQQELATLQQRADQQLAGVGPRPVEDLERWYEQLSQEG